MKKISFGNLQDFGALMVRNKWWAATVFLLSFYFTALLTYLLPDTFISEELILIEPQGIPSEFIKNLTVGVDERLKALQETVLSRTNLLQIIHEFRKELPDISGLTEEDQVANLKSHINVEFQTESGRGSPIFSFKLFSENQNPKVAQKITNRLSSSFMEFDNRSRKARVLGTTEFLEDELRKVAEQLQQAEGTRRELKERYRYELPDQSEMNLRTLDRLQEQLKANSEAFDRYVTLRLSLERQISETSPFIEAIESRGSQDRTTISPILAEYKEKERAYKDLAAKYTEKYPDVIRAKSELDQLKKEIPAQSFIEKPTTMEPKVTTKPNPVYQKLVAQLEDVKTEIGIRDRQRGQIQAEISKYTQRLENSPQAEQAITTTFRDYEALSKRYEDLKSKLSEAKLAKNLESKDERTQFVILDPANLPVKPAKPNRLKLILIGLFLSLGLSVVVVTGVDFFGQKLWTQAEVEKLLGVPVLIEIPEIVSDEDLHRIKRQTLVATLALIIVVAFCLVTLYFLHTNHQLRGTVAGYVKPVLKMTAPIMSRLD
ncbi:MAG TPA: hypothetical protein VGK99_22730 [Acidobacteriota bacterium]|jgi:polysaccharide chain length determinant protein (PEP-CTERM system associated)